MHANIHKYIDRYQLVGGVLRCPQSLRVHLKNVSGLVCICVYGLVLFLGC